MLWTNKVLMCRPDFFRVNYNINAWMTGPDLSPEDRIKANEQWLHLHHTVIRCGGYVEYIDPVDGLPDMVFTANGGLVHGRKVVLPRFTHKERQLEEKSFTAWFRSKGYEVLELQSANDRFEGNGDSFVFRDTLYLGVGDRSSAKVAGRILDFLDLKKVVLCELINPKFYHLDTCFCPLSDQDVLWYPEAFSRASQEAIKNERLNLISVSEEEALRFACNSICLGKNLIMPDYSEELVKKLTAPSFRYTIINVCLDQFIKAGGAARCLTLNV